jgi:glucan phosphoethanolaminetransferase (alkaline phosphatase superfamily)
MTYRIALICLATLALGLVDLLLVRDVDWLRDNVSGLRFQVNFGLSLLVLGVLLQWLAGLWHRSRAACVVVLVCTALIYYVQAAYFGVYQKYIGVFDLRFFAADPVMSIALYAENGAVLRPLLAALTASAVLVWVMRWQHRPPKWWRWVGRVVAVLVFVLLTVNWYSAPAFQLAPLAYAGNVVRALDLRTGKNSDAVIDRPALQQRTARPDAPNIVWVIGESLSPKHMGLYGYPRPTTPQLSRMHSDGEVIVFDNVLSIGTRTMVSVPYMLHGLQGIDPQGLIYKTPSIFNYARSAGYQTALITAQDFQWRNIDRLFVDKDLGHFQQGTEFSSSVNVSVGADDLRVLDRGVLPFWERSTRAATQPVFLVTQMSGSHPPFDAQVPQALKQFLPETGPNSVNAYDNTVWYTDLYLSRLVAQVRARSPNTWVFFTSDHGQYVGDRETRFHGDLGDPVTHVPLLVFPPASQGQNMGPNTRAPVSQADIMATVLDIMGLQAVTAIDGLSLRQNIPADRVRIVSPYMITLHNDPKAAIVLPDGQRHEIDFTQQSVKWSDGRVTPYSELPQQWRERIDARQP